MRKTLACLGVIAALAIATPVKAALIGNTSGPDSSDSINMFFFNTGPVDILSLTLDGSTATAFPVLWDSIGTQGGSAAPAGSVSGVDTQVVTFSFSAGAFASGDLFSLSGMDPDGVPSPELVNVGQLEGVTVEAVFADQTVFLGQFVDNTFPGLGLLLQGETVAIELPVIGPVPIHAPIPAAAPLLASALFGLGFFGWRRKRMAA